MSKKKGLHITKVDLLLKLEQFVRQIDNGNDAYSINSEELNSLTGHTRYKITVNSKDISFDVYYRADKTVIITPLGKEQSKEFGEGFKLFVENSMKSTDIVQSSVSPQSSFSSQGSFNCNIKDEVFQELKQYLSTLKGVSVLSEKDNGLNGFMVQFSSEIGDKITLTYFQSKRKLCFQGHLMKLHIEIKNFLAAYMPYVETAVDVDLVGQISDNDVNKLALKLMNLSYKKLDPLFRDLLYDSLKSMLTRTKFKDYSVWTFPALRALEGRIKQIFSFYGIDIDDKRGFGENFCFDAKNKKHKLEQESIRKVAEWNAINNLNACYNYFVQTRHQLFHVDAFSATTRRLETPEMAENIIYDVCSLIETSYIDLSMNCYRILLLQGEYKLAVVATSYLNPFDDIDKIEQELNEFNCKFSGQVLFDLLLCNGLNSNRYVMVNFEAGKFVVSSLVRLNRISESCKKFINDYLKKNDLFLDVSVLPAAQRYLIRNNKVI